MVFLRKRIRASFFYRLLIQLSKWEDWNLINRLNPATLLCLFQAWISNVICHCLFYAQWIQLRWEVAVLFIDIFGIDYHHFLNFIFKYSSRKLTFILYRIRVMVFKATYNNISVISGWSVLLVEKTGVPEKNHRPAAIHWQTFIT